MASGVLEKVRVDAFALSESERAELAHDLVASLDGPSDADSEAAWEGEVLRRLSEIDAGTAKLVDREEFTRRIRIRLSGG